MRHLSHYYKGKKVFLTGHTGFKGAWLLKWLHMLGAEIKGYALAPINENDLYNLIAGDVLCESVIADIRDKDRVNKEIFLFQPDFVFHLAAQPLVRLSYSAPVETFEVNAIGTANVLEAFRALESPAIAVMVTTDKVYHNKEIDYYYKEDDQLGGYDPYSSSKACAELIIQSFRNSFFNPSKYNSHKKSVSVARSGNVIGGGDWSADRIVPDAAKAFAAGEPVAVRNPRSVRPWQHVLDPLHGYLTLAAYQSNDPVKYGEAFNFGPAAEDTSNVEQLVKKAAEVWGDAKYTTNVREDLHEAGMLKLDISKAAAELSWTPKLRSDEAITETMSWYKRYYSHPNSIADYTAQSIEKFMEG